MLERIIISITVFGILFLLFKYIRRSQLSTAQHTAEKLSTQTESQLLYFSSSVCSQCLGQEQILNEIFQGNAYQGIHLKKYSIEKNTELAKQWAVKTLPTTILLSRYGEVKQINNGLVSATELNSQLRNLLIEK